MEKNKLFTADRRAHRGKFYRTGVWRRIRKAQLRKEPLCRICYESKPRKLVEANTCDHINPLWESWEDFVKGPFQSLCSGCHKEKTSLEDLPKLIKAERCTIRVADI